MRTGYIMLFGGITALVIYLFMLNSIYNEYENQHFTYWNLADKSSLIEEKSKYIDKMVYSFEKSNLSGKYNAVFFKNPSCYFDKNLEALISLRDRLKEIKHMDVSSFEYQTAMSQITGQEQGEASDMLGVLQGCWFKEHHIMFWNWVGTIIILSLVVIIFVGLFKVILSD